MNAEIYDPIPATLFRQLMPFSPESTAGGWDGLFRAIPFLQARYPGTVFRRQPYHHVDLARKRVGLLFVEELSERLYFVFDMESAEPPPLSEYPA
ncbi:hypothetical protein [Methylomagnum ishizawai]|uniref:hypothetical protein n=1 Tax=Methylomagnum ishizawai TaxID=1760988 RepID=UPI001C326D03|nr:hypothetical protein [Methylomagnum ishizawai]BBL76639.1 hypothetical protein MishRS11D_37370 [Methylomagnum ishizawai]